MTFSSVQYLFSVCNTGNMAQTHAQHTHTHPVRGYWLPVWAGESRGGVEDDLKNNGTNIQMSIQLRRQRVTFVRRTRVPNYALLILNLYLLEAGDE